LTSPRRADIVPDDMDPARFRGVLPPIPTPFDTAGEVDLRALRTNVRRWMETGLTGIVALGSNGEAPLLDEDEAGRLIAAAREEVPADRLLIAGTGRESTRATIAATRRASERGADAVLVLTPSFFKAQLTPAALVRHYSAVADASPVPVLLYNFAAATGVNLLPGTVAALCEHPNVAGIKESGLDVSQLSDCVMQARPGFAVFAGAAPTFYPALCAGAVGGILAVASVVPEACVRLFDLVAAGRHAEARRLQEQLSPLARLVTTVHGVAGLKLALDQCGWYGGPPRPPLGKAAAGAAEAVGRALADLQGALAR
jgi:4-hydroxy-2-oxoglutarate aldolase